MIPKPPKPTKKPRKWLRKRRKRSPKAILFDRVWKKCSEYVRRRDGGRCYTCGNVKNWKEQQAGHYKHGKTKPTFFNTDQIHCQCARCNHFLNGNLSVYAERLIKDIGQEKVNAISLASYKIKLWKAEELKKLERHFDRKLKELN